MKPLAGGDPIVFRGRGISILRRVGDGSHEIRPSRPVPPRCGAGQTGVGLEVAGGVGLTGERVRLEAQGRMLVLHTATGYEETGRERDGERGRGWHEPGLTASLRPRWGAPGLRGRVAVARPVPELTPTARSATMPGSTLGSATGLRLPGGSLLTPFGGYGRTGSGRRVQAGANLGMLDRGADGCSDGSGDHCPPRLRIPDEVEHRVLG